MTPFPWTPDPEQAKAWALAAFALVMMTIGLAL